MAGRASSRTPTRGTTLGTEPEPARGRTRTEQVYSQLRDDILSGRLVPGARLPFAELGTRYQSSASAIREGLQRLVEQGLVHSEPQQGFSVTTLSPDDLLDLTFARCEIEGLALRLAIEHGDLAWESGIVAALHTLDRTPVGHASPTSGRALGHDWTAAHRAFHEALIAGCPNRRIRAMASSLRDAAELYRHWSWAVTDVERDVAAEHRSLAEATLARDVDVAVAALRDHLTATTTLLVHGVGGADADAPGTRRARRSSALAET